VIVSLDAAGYAIIGGRHYAWGWGRASGQWEPLQLALGPRPLVRRAHGKGWRRRGNGSALAFLARWARARRRAHAKRVVVDLQSWLDAGRP